MKRNYNFSLIIRWMSVILVITILVNFGVIFYAMNRLSENSLESLSHTMSMDARDFEGSLENIHGMMLSELAYDTDLDILTMDEKYQKSIDIIAIKRRLKNIITNWSKECAFGVNYAIYIPNNNIAINDCATYEEYDLWREVGPWIMEEVFVPNAKSGWTIRKLGGQYFITNVISGNNRYIICYISLMEALGQFKNELYGENYYITAGQEGEAVYYERKRLLKDGINISKEAGPGKRPGLFDEYLVIQNEIGEFLNIYIIIHDFNNILKVFQVQIFLFLLLGLMLFFVLWFLFFLYRTVVRPIESFNENIERLKNDEMYTLATHYQINELGNASELMADMVSKIKGLKIDIYEKTLEQQKTKMDFLTLQIEPHFYLNCLNIIHNMAQMGEYQNIQRLSLCVSQYLRYIFKSRETLVTVGEELDHIDKYLEIQRIRYKGGFDTEICVEDEIRKAKLPPLVIQTFVENALKHTITWEDDIELTITGKKIIRYGKSYGCLIVEDTGEGFPEDVLQKLINGRDISEGEKRIGIMNTISRMRLTFDGRERLEFYNRAGGGAGVRIEFPVL